jgi:VanZ family protein
MPPRLISFLDSNNLLLFRGYIFFIFLLVVLPINSQQNIALNNNYIVHIRLDHLLHSILFIPWFWISYRIRNHPVLLSIALGLAIAVLAEGIQYFLPYRAFNINDMISNIIGIALSLPLYASLPKILKRT